MKRVEFQRTVNHNAQPSHVTMGEIAMQEGPRQKSKSRAFFQSLILPGWGQHYAGSQTMMKVFAVSEIVLLTTYVGFKTWSGWQKDDYETFAASHASVKPDGKPAQFFVDIGNYGSIFDYNQAQLRSRSVTSLYPVTEEFFWNWDTRENRSAFDDLRVSSDTANNRAELTIAILVLNHLASAIQATLAVHNYNNRLGTDDLGFDIRFEDDSSVRFLLTKCF